MSTKSPILVSIVIPCYNDYLYIEEAFKSAINQTYNNTEVILVDDGSNQKTKNIISTFNDTKLKVITQENRGLSAARNFGIENAKGEFILLHDADDKFDPTFIEKALPYFYDEKCGAVTCWGRKFFEDELLGEFRPKGGSLKNFLFKNSAVGTSLLRKTCWKDIGGYDENMKLGYEDWEFYIRLTQKHTIAVIPEILFFYRQGQNSMRKVALKNHDKSIKQFIYIKHKKLYIEHYEATINHFLDINQNLKSEIAKSRNTIDHKVGRTILSPLRKLKLFWNS